MPDVLATQDPKVPDPSPKRGRGRPKKILPLAVPAIPESVVKDLKAQIVLLENKIKEGQTRADPYRELRELSEIIRIIQRAVKGLPPEDDIFQGLIDVTDIKERTRLNEQALLSHAAMRTAFHNWPEFKLYNTIAEMEDKYFISEDGEGRKEGILLQQAKTGTDRNNLVLNMPNTQGGPAQDPSNPAPPKKKSIIDKVLRR